VALSLEGFQKERLSGIHDARFPGVVMLSSQRITNPVRRMLGIPCHAHHSRHALNDLVIGGKGGQRAVLPNLGNGTVDEARVNFLELVELET